MTRWILSVAAVAALTVPAVAQDDAKKIVEKAVAAHGGLDNLKKYKASKATMSGDMSIAGMELTFDGTVFSEYPGKVKVTVDASIMGQKLSVVQVADGDKAKHKVMLGGMDVSGGGEAEKEELKNSAVMQDISHIYPLLDDKRFSLKAEADGDVDGKKVAVLKVTSLNNSKTITLSFDKDSGLLVKTQRKSLGAGADGSPKEVDEESFVGDYKKINGIMTPMKTTVKHDGAKFMTFTLSDVEILESLPKGTFATDD